MLGISVKVWQLGWEEQQGQFTISNSSVFVFQDRANEDLSYIHSVIRHLTGDGSLDEVCRHSLPSLEDEVLLKGEPMLEEPIIKLEVKERQGPAEEDNDDGNNNNDDVKDYSNDYEDHLDHEDETYIQPGAYSLKNETLSQQNHVGKKKVKCKNQGLYPCGLCGQFLKTEKALIRHGEKTHTKDKDKHLKEQKQFLCEQEGCSEMFALRKLLWSHMLAEHGIDISPENKERFVCNVCGKKCPSKHDLEKHVVKHTDEKNFVCMECGKQFKGETGLKVHMKRHQGIFDHKCTDCDAAYTSASALNAHRLAKHTPGHSFMCPECGQGFKYQNALDKHRTLHTGEKRYQCRYCEKRFRLFTIRANHERVHRGIKEFQCSMCPKQFMQQDQLRVHIKRHLNQRDHVCKVCTKAFIEPVGLRKHNCSGRAPEHV